MQQRRFITLLAVALFVCFITSSPAGATDAPDPDPGAPQPAPRYALDDPHEKLTDNHGEGFEALYGTRNFRSVLDGIAYRGGANNKWNRDGRRDNRNPLPDVGLKNLCEEGFGRSYYLYSTNFEQASPVTHCETPSGANHRLDYRQRSPFDADDRYEMLRAVHDAIRAKSGTPIYFHCWNGWHASGLIAANILQQFCDMPADEAVAYWDANTDGHDQEPRYERIRQRIREFEPYPDLKIDPETAARICP